MKIFGLVTNDFEIEIGKKFDDAGEAHVVKEIKYFESSQVYNRFIHEPIYVVEYTEGTMKTVIPVRAVTALQIDTKKEEAIKPDLAGLGE